MKSYELVPYTDADHDSYIKCQIDAFKKYIMEFFGVLDMSVMEGQVERIALLNNKFVVRYC